MAEITTYAIACLCPKCGMPGEVRSKNPVRDRAHRGATLHMVYCMNPPCPWYETAWVVQVNADGSIPQPTDGRKDNSANYPKRPWSDETVDKLQRQLERQLELEQKGGAEVANPNTPRRF